MFFRKAKLIAYLRQQIAWLSGQLAQSEQKAEGYRSIAEKALELAKEKHFPKVANGDLLITWDGTPRPPTNVEAYRVELVQPDYIAPEAKNCPECSVSVRSDSWPQECPACHCVFGFEEN